MKFKRYKRRVEEYLKKHYLIDLNDIGLDDDDLERAMNDGEKPKDLIEGIAYKYDLEHY